MIQSWTFLFDNLNNPFHSSLDNVQVMTRDDFSQHGLEYYDVKCKRGREDDEAKKSIVHPDLERKDCDSSVDQELFGSVWDNIAEKDAGGESSERTPMTPWQSILQVSEDNLFLVVCSTEYALNMIVIFNLNRLR